MIVENIKYVSIFYPFVEKQWNVTVILDLLQNQWLFFISSACLMIRLLVAHAGGNVIDKNNEEEWSKNRPLKNTTLYRNRIRKRVVNLHNLSAVTQIIGNPQK